MPLTWRCSFDSLCRACMKSVLGQLLNGRYFVTHELGRKANYCSYRAEDRRNSNTVACIIKQFSLSSKNLEANGLTKTQFRSSLFTQVEQIRQFNNHTQIPKISDYFLWGEELFLIREYVPGVSLAAETKERLIEETELIEILRQIANVLKVIHRGKQQHLNLKPENIILYQTKSAEDRVCVTDFGTLRQTIESKSVAGKFKSKLRQAEYYLAPEQRLGKAEYRSDFYALGAIAIKALTGKFVHQIAFQDLDNYARAALVDESTGDRFQISSSFAKLLHSLVQIDLHLRPQSITEIAIQLKQSNNKSLPILGATSQPKATPHGSSKSKPTEHQRKNKLLSLIGISSILIFGTAFGYLWRQLQPQQLNFVQYRNSDRAIAIDYPADWTIEELEDPITGGVLVITAPLEDESDTFREQVYLSIDPLDDPQSYEKTLIDKIVNVRGVSNIYYQEAAERISDRPAHSMVYQRQQDNLDLQQKEVFTFVRDKAYLVTYVAEKERYLNFLPVVDRIIRSLKIEG